MLCDRCCPLLHPVRALPRPWGLTPSPCPQPPGTATTTTPPPAPSVPGSPCGSSLSSRSPVQTWTPRAMDTPPGPVWSPPSWSLTTPRCFSCSRDPWGAATGPLPYAGPEGHELHRDHCVWEVAGTWGCAWLFPGCAAVTRAGVCPHPCRAPWTGEWTASLHPCGEEPPAPLELRQQGISHRANPGWPQGTG